MKKDLYHPNLIIGLITFILLLFSIGLRANRYNNAGDKVVIATFILGAIHWIWSMIDVLKDYRTNKDRENKKIVWVILVLIVPPLGGIIYYAFHKNVRI